MVASAPIPVHIRLTPDQMRDRILCGLKRAKDVMENGRKARTGETGPVWDRHIEGACGEQAAAVALGIPCYEMVNTFGDPDLPGKVQVRTRTPEKHDGYKVELQVRPDETRKGHRYVLVIGVAPDFDVWGWIPAAEAVHFPLKDKGRKGCKAHWVPREKLYPISELRALVEGET